MTTAETRSPVSTTPPSEDTLRHQLDIQWQDHIQTREQTWKTLQIEAAMFLAIIGADVTLDSPLMLVPLGGVLLFATAFGVAVTIHHRKVQIQKFQFIFLLEDKLGLHRPGYLTDLTSPADFKWTGVFDFRKIATPTFILVMHLLILAFVVVYIALRLGI